ncbi:unnamed protein product [Eruca vesicaria subsp. sativa]|uniref:Uncharacterized protein n=1 Tax=Eruca vesicaria subsp. sativa TaxID=29727 RepID=A0ABC8LHN7_ERUVS|nr:unnamed protein product [Eruca vesicaria subsp. sativa]
MAYRFVKTKLELRFWGTIDQSYDIVFCLYEPNSPLLLRVSTEEPRDNDNSGNVHGSRSALYICSILVCSSFGSTRRSNHQLYASNLSWILGCVFNFNTLNPTHSVLVLAYLFDMLLSSTSTTISSTLAAIDSNFDPLKKRRKVFLV